MTSALKLKKLLINFLKNMINRLFFGIAAFGVILTGCASNQNDNISRLSLIQKRDELICGVSGKIPGFSFIEGDGSYKGLDVDNVKPLLQQ